MNWVLLQYVIALASGSVILILVAAFVYLNNPKNKINRIFALYSLAIAIWSGCEAYSITAPTKALGLLGWRINHLGVAFIPAFFLHFMSLLFDIEKENRKLIISVYLYSILFAIMDATPLLIADVAPRFSFKYMVVPGKLYTFFIIVWAICVGVGLLKLFQIYHTSTGVRRKQLKYYCYATLFGYIGGAPNFLPAFNIEIFPLMPFGTYAVPAYILIVTYAIIRYRFMGIDTVIHRTILWILTIFLLIVPVGIIYDILKEWLARLSPIWVVSIVSATLLIFLNYYHRFKPRVDHLFRRRKYDYQTILGKVAEKIATTINIEDLTRYLLTEVCEAMYLRNSLLYVLAKDEKKYLLIGRRGYLDSNGVRQRTILEIYSEEEKNSLAKDFKELGVDNPLCKWEIDHKDILEKEQVEIDPKYAPIKEQALRWLEERELELIIPLIFEDKVTALLGLGRKENLQSYAAQDIELLKKLGREAGVTIFNALHYEDSLEKGRLDEEMKMGREIQMSLLPKDMPDVPGLNIQGVMQPAKEIGGDYYDFISLPDRDNLAIVIGDVSGKGVAAGLLMSMAKATIHTLSQEGFSPREVLLRANQFLHQNIGGQKFMTLLYLLWQPKTRTLIYSSAGHEHILLYRANQGPATTGRTTAGVVEAILSGGFMLGMLPDIGTFLEEKQIKVEPGDKILLYTDGVTEAENKNRDRFGLSRLEEVFRKYSQEPAQQLMEDIKTEVYSFIGDHAQYDDVTLVVMEVK
jgi:serine phosphatase RsbU (regulator of sigma subunit)